MASPLPLLIVILCLLGSPSPLALMAPAQLSDYLQTDVDSRCPALVLLQLLPPLMNSTKLVIPVHVIS